MKKNLFVSITVLLLSYLIGCNTSTQTKEGKVYAPIEVETPERPAGQQDVVGLTVPKMETVRVGFIGLGMRGISAVERWTHIPGVQINALCDLRPELVKEHKRRSPTPTCRKLLPIRTRRMPGRSCVNGTISTLFIS